MSGIFDGFLFDSIIFDVEEEEEDEQVPIVDNLPQNLISFLLNISNVNWFLKPAKKLKIQNPFVLANDDFLKLII